MATTKTGKARTVRAGPTIINVHVHSGSAPAKKSPKSNPSRPKKTAKKSGGKGKGKR